MAEAFHLQLRNITLKAQKSLDALVRQSAQDLVDDAQRPVGSGGRMPIDTGFLRNSINVQVGDSSPPEAQPRGKGLSRSQRMAASASDPAYESDIAQAKAGGVIAITWTAAYAGFVEYGARGQKARMFAQGASQKWQRFVNDNAKRIKERGG